MDKRDSSQAFTLIEVLITIAIIGILTSTVTVSLNAFRLKAQANEALADVVRITGYLETYKADNGFYPRSCDTGSGGGGVWASRDANPWGCGLGYCWIPQLAAYGYCPALPPNLFPHNRNPAVGVPNQSQYIYYTNVAGSEYKLIYHIPVSMGVPGEFIDPIRPTWAFGTWSPGGVGF